MSELRTTPSVAIVGATGAVGRELLALIAERRFPCRELRLLASARSAGTTLTCGDRSIAVETLTDDSSEDSFDGVDLALFSAGGSVSRRFAPLAVAAGATVIDNSSAFRMDPDVPLVVPEINGDLLDDDAGPRIIANPNCTTIITLMAVTPIDRVVGVERMVVSTYQAVSGAGGAYLDELEQQTRDFVAGRPYTTDASGRQMLFNVYPHDSPVGPDGTNEEEAKIRRETEKIWGRAPVRISATCVRVPVRRVHCAAINLTLRAPLDEADARTILGDAPGVRIVDDRADGRFPESILADGLDDVLVGRVRVDASQTPGLGLDLFVAGDQLRKGAALNAMQIAERLIASWLTSRCVRDSPARPGASSPARRAPPAPR